MSQIYRNIHNWVSYNWGKANHCEKCGLNKPNGIKRTFCWANLNKKYRKIRKEWKQMCYSCHKKHDMKKFNIEPWNKGKVGKQKNHNISGLNKGGWNKGMKLKPKIICKCGIEFYPPKWSSKFCSKSCATKARF